MGFIIFLWLLLNNNQSLPENIPDEPDSVRFVMETELYEGWRIYRIIKIRDNCFIQRVEFNLSTSKREVEERKISDNEFQKFINLLDYLEYRSFNQSIKKTEKTIKRRPSPAKRTFSLVEYYRNYNLTIRHNFVITGDYKVSQDNQYDIDTIERAVLILFEVRDNDELLYWR